MLIGEGGTGDEREKEAMRRDLAAFDSDIIDRCLADTDRGCGK